MEARKTLPVNFILETRVFRLAGFVITLLILTNETQNKRGAGSRAKCVENCKNNALYSVRSEAMSSECRINAASYLSFKT